MDQILCIPRPGSTPGRADSLEFVLIDFAFAPQHLGRYAKLDERDDVHRLWFVLTACGLTNDMAEEIGWFDRDECEV